MIILVSICLGSVDEGWSGMEGTGRWRGEEEEGSGGSYWNGRRVIKARRMEGQG